MAIIFFKDFCLFKLWMLIIYSFFFLVTYVFYWACRISVTLTFLMFVFKHWVIWMFCEFCFIFQFKISQLILVLLIMKCLHNLWHHSVEEAVSRLLSQIITSVVKMVLNRCYEIKTLCQTNLGIVVIVIGSSLGDHYNLQCIFVVKSFAINFHSKYISVHFHCKITSNTFL